MPLSVCAARSAACRRSLVSDSFVRLSPIPFSTYQQLQGFQHLPARERICRTLRKLTKSRTDIRKLWNAVLERNGNSADLEQSVTSTSVADVWQELLNKGIVGYGGPEDNEEEVEVQLSDHSSDGEGMATMPLPRQHAPAVQRPSRSQPVPGYDELEEEEEEDDDGEDDDDASSLSTDPRWGSRPSKRGARGRGAGATRGRGRGGRKAAAGSGSARKLAAAAARGDDMMDDYSQQRAPMQTTARARAMQAVAAAKATAQLPEPRQKRRRTSLDDNGYYDSPSQQQNYDLYGGGGGGRNDRRMDSPGYFPDQQSPYYPMNTNQSYSFEGASPASYGMPPKNEEIVYPDPVMQGYPYASTVRAQTAPVPSGDGNPHWRWVNEEEEMDDEISPWQDDGIETNNHELSSNDVVLCTHLLESFARRGYVLQPFVDGAWIEGVAQWRLAPRKDLSHRPLQGKRRNPVLVTYPPPPPGGQRTDTAPPYQPAQQQTAGQRTVYPGDVRMGGSFPYQQDRFHEQSAASFHDPHFYQNDAPTPASGNPLPSDRRQDRESSAVGSEFLHAQHVMMSPFDSSAHVGEATGQTWTHQGDSMSVASPPPSAAPAPASHLMSMFGANGGNTSAPEIFASIASPSGGALDTYSPAAFKSDATSPAATNDVGGK